MMNVMWRMWFWAGIRSPWLWPATIVLSAASVALVVFAGVAAPARPLIALWFLLLCPGMALVRLMRVGGIATELSLAVALSLALDALVAGVMIYTKTWAPTRGLLVLIAISVVGAVLQASASRHMIGSAEDKL
jgi:hypothetical protein